MGTDADVQEIQVECLNGVASAHPPLQFVDDRIRHRQVKRYMLVISPRHQPEEVFPLRHSAPFGCFIAAATAAMCSGVVPQQPPTILTPSAAARMAHSANSAGVTA